MAETLVQESTPATDPRSPINNLNFDILIAIFEINANLHWTSRGLTDVEQRTSRSRPLDVLRQTSQVCRQWREIILGSASLWGMVIDLDLLASDEEDYWTKEVMKRAGKSALYVCGQLDGSKSTSRDFFVSFLDKNWERIRRLDATVTQGHLWGARAWDVLFRPSPELEVVKLRNRGGWYPLLPSQSHHPSPIFADIASALREFAIDEAPSSWLSLRAPWLSQLHSLVISTPFTFNATEVLAALAGIPALEHLELRNISPPISDQLTRLSLPFLRTLTISKDFTTSLFFLKSITPPAGSALNLTMYDYNSISDQDIHNFCKEIIRYMESFFNWAPFANSLILEPGKHIFKIRGCRSSSEIESIPNHSDFSISISGGRRTSTSLPPLGTLKLLASIATCSFGHIRKFEFLPSEALYNVQSLQHNLATLFSSLFSVELLVTSTYGLELLLDSPASSSDIFPLLRTLWLKAGGKTASFPTVTGSLFNFLRWKTVVGRRIATLDVSESVLSEEWLDWTCLDVIDGLKVILRRDENGVEEYICGTGTPERLQLRRGF